MRDHATNRSRGFGFITFETEQAVDDLLEKGNKIEFAGAQVCALPIKLIKFMYIFFLQSLTINQISLYLLIIISMHRSNRFCGLLFFFSLSCGQVIAFPCACTVLL